MHTPIINPLKITFLRGGRGDEKNHNFTVRGANFKKKMKAYKFPSEKEYMYEVSSKSENGKMVKFRGKIFWGGILKKK